MKFVIADVLSQPEHRRKSKPEEIPIDYLYDICNREPYFFRISVVSQAPKPITTMIPEANTQNGI